MTDLTPGLHIGPYVLEALVGQGSSGEVWRASDGTRPVAVKFMHAALLASENAPKHRQRLAQEVWALGRLRNIPHIPALYGENLDAPRPYFVMQYVDGEPFHALISSGEMMFIPLRQRLRLLDQLANTLTLIHLRGIIHRDIKPANIHGVVQPFIMDFSVAISEMDAATAEPGIGTGVYMPPSDGLPPDKLNDTFAFALVAYEILFGQHAIFAPGETANTLTATRARLRERLHDGTWYRPTTLTEGEIPANLRGVELDLLEAVFVKALGGRAHRYKDARDFVADLHRVIVTPGNRPFLDELPSVTARHLGPGNDEHYTLHEVQQATHPTDHGPAARSRKRRRGPRRWVWALIAAALVFVWALALVLLVVAPR